MKTLIISITLLSLPTAVLVALAIIRENKKLDRIAKKANDQGIGDGWEDDEHKYV